MSLFDFFKKPNSMESKNQQGPKAAKSFTDNPLSSPELQKKRFEAAKEFLKFFQGKTPLLNGKPHAGTVLSVAARLAGTSLFRAINRQEVPPGVVVLSEEVNTAYPQLLKLFAVYCKQNGIDVLAKPLVEEIPDRDKPLMELSQVQSEYQDRYNAIMKKHGLDDLESARAGMVIAAMFFQYHCIANKDIDPYVATKIVGMGVVEGAKTGPVPRKSEGGHAPENKNTKSDEAERLVKTVAGASLSGSGERLVLGEPFTAMKEAMNNGGKYILVHPEVANQLKQAGLDPYIVNITALIMEMESKISRIEFVEADVERLVQEWSNKSKDQAPIYVRQMLWLKANAAKYGYQQEGNSWKLM